jgi:hypothetical protein
VEPTQHSEAEDEDEIEDETPGDLFLLFHYLM